MFFNQLRDEINHKKDSADTTDVVDYYNSQILGICNGYQAARKQLDKIIDEAKKHYCKYNINNQYFLQYGSSRTAILFGGGSLIDVYWKTQ